MNTGVKVLLAVLILALALDIALIVVKTRQSNPERDSGGSASGSNNTVSTGSSMVFNFSGAVNRSEGDSSALDGLGEEDMGKRALAEETGSGSD